MGAISRREWLGAAAAAPGPGRLARPPNILWIICDQLAAGALGCYGGPFPTPHIDRLARDGVLFTEATCATPFCSPSRASMITGLYPHSHGIVTNVNRRDYPAIPAPPSEEGIKAGDITTGKLLHTAGYSTHHYGKWHLMDEDLAYYPDMYGEHHEYAREMAAVFERVRQSPDGTWMNWYGWSLPVSVSPAFRAAAASAVEKWGNAAHAGFIAKAGRLEFPLQQVFDVRVADKTVQRIQAAGSQPWMVTCSFNYPHDPNVVPSPYYEAFAP